MTITSNSSSIFSNPSTSVQPDRFRTILHIRRGIYRIVGGGKFIGKIIDASDVYPRLMAVTYLFFADEHY
jgi:hypothetical protein